MALPAPEPGIVVAFNYLWRRERDEGRENARCPRPCVIILTLRHSDARVEVLVVPITHSEPRAGDRVLELPRQVKQHLGLDEARSWIVVDEVNEFVWPGFDLTINARGDVAYGFIPPRLYERVRTAVLACARAGDLSRVRR